MGRAPRPRPERLAVKLLQIRTKLGLTQQQMFERLGDTGTRLYARHVDDYEKDRRIPHLEVVLAYARAAGIAMEVIVDDKLDLPGKLTHMPEAGGVTKRGRRRER